MLEKLWKKWIQNHMQQYQFIYTTTLYEYGDGIYALPLERRIQEKLEKFSQTHDILSVNYESYPEKYLGLNCLGIPTWKPRECFIYVVYMEE